MCGYGAEIAAVQVDPPPPLNDNDPGGSLTLSFVYDLMVFRKFRFGLKLIRDNTTS